MKNNLKKIIFSILLRLAGLAMVVVCVQNAQAGWWFYQGQVAAENHDYVTAIKFYEKGRLEDPALLLKLGENLWKKGKKEKQVRDFQKSREVFESLTEKVPAFGKAWLYLALTENAVKSSIKPLTEKQWKSVRQKIDKALIWEPSGAWMSYSAATLILSQKIILSAKEKEEALELLRRSILAHDPSQPPVYLEPALVFLWKTYADKNMLETVTPRDENGYRILLQFLEKNNLWSYREEIFSQYQRYKNSQVIAQVNEGKEWFRKENYRAAENSFQQAFWYDQQNQQQSLTGLIAAQGLLGKLPEGFQAPLEKILKNDEQSVNFFLPYLKNAVEVSGNSFIRGLFLYRMKDYDSAVKEFQAAGDKVSKERLDYYVISAHLRADHVKEAVEKVKKKLAEERPDPRIFYFFFNIPELQQPVKLKLKTLLTAELPESGWQDKESQPKNILTKRARLGRFLCLKPGLGKLKIKMRSRASSEGYYAYAVFRLWDEDIEKNIGERYAGNPGWFDYEIPFHSSGGNRMLEIELYNGNEDGKTPKGVKGPELELGALEVSYS